MDGSLPYKQKGVPQQATPRVQRWALTLAAYEYKIAYKAGETNANADALSRLPLSGMPESVPIPGETVLLLEQLDHTPVNSCHIREWTRCDPILSRVYQFTLNGWPNYTPDAELHPYLSRKAELTIEDGCVLWGNRLIVPPQGRPRVIAEFHEVHPGISRMRALARGYVWWPNMDSELEKAVKSCSWCQLHQKAPKEALLHPWEWPGQPWSRLHNDYAGPYKGHMYLVLIDAYSKWIDVHMMKSTTSAATFEKLREIFATHGLPENIVRDNGPNFTRAEYQGFPREEWYQTHQSFALPPRFKWVGRVTRESIQGRNEKDGRRKLADPVIAVPIKVPDNTSLNDRCYASSTAYEEENKDKIGPTATQYCKSGQAETRIPKACT